jgi:hypothetical protein
MKVIGPILEGKGCKQFQRLGLLAVCFAILARYGDADCVGPNNRIDN